MNLRFWSRLGWILEFCVSRVHEALIVVHKIERKATKKKKKENRKKQRGEPGARRFETEI